MSSRETGRAWNVRTLRLLFNSVAKSPVRASNVSLASDRVPVSVVATFICTFDNQSTKRMRCGKCSRPFRVSLLVIKIAYSRLRRSPNLVVV